MQNAPRPASRTDARLPRSLLVAVLLTGAALTSLPLVRRGVPGVRAEPVASATPTLPETAERPLASSVPTESGRRAIEVAPEAAPARATGLYAAAVGRRLDYAFGYETSVAALPSEEATGEVSGSGTLGCRIEGTLRASVLARRDDQVQVEVTFPEVEVAFDLPEAAEEQAQLVREDLERPMVLRISASGDLLGLRLAPGTEPGLANLRRSLVLATRFVVPEEGEPTWTRVEPELGSSVRVRYAWASGPGTARPVLGREKLEGLSARPAAPGEPKLPKPVLEGFGRATFDRELGWWVGIEADEVLTLDAGVLRARQEQHVRLELVDAGWSEAAPAPVDWSGAWAAVDGFAEASEIGRRREETRRRDELADVSLRELAARLEAAFSDAGALDAEAFEHLRAIRWKLRLDDESVVELRRLVQEPGLEPTLRDVLLQAAGQAGTVACQLLLTNLLTDPAVGEDLRLASAKALFDIEEPGDATLEAVTEAIRETSEATEEWRVALLALGALAQESGEASDVAYLLALEEEAAERGESATWLTALRNAAHEETLAIASPYLDHPDLGVRLAALRAIAHCPAPGTLEALREVAQTATSPIVRDEARRALEELENTNS